MGASCWRRVRTHQRREREADPQRDSMAPVAERAAAEHRAGEERAQTCGTEPRGGPGQSGDDDPGGREEAVAHSYIHGIHEGTACGAAPHLQPDADRGGKGRAHVPGGEHEHPSVRADPALERDQEHGELRELHEHATVVEDERAEQQHARRIARHLHQVGALVAEDPGGGGDIHAAQHERGHGDDEEQHMSSRRAGQIVGHRPPVAAARGCASVGGLVHRSSVAARGSRPGRAQPPFGPSAGQAPSPADTSTGI